MQAKNFTDVDIDNNSVFITEINHEQKHIIPPPSPSLGSNFSFLSNNVLSGTNPFTFEPDSFDAVNFPSIKNEIAPAGLDTNINGSERTQHEKMSTGIGFRPPAELINNNDSNNSLSFYSQVPPNELDHQLFKLSNKWVLTYGNIPNQPIGLTCQIACGSWQIVRSLLKFIHLLLESSMTTPELNNINIINVTGNSNTYCVFKEEDLQIEIGPTLFIRISIRGSYGRIESETGSYSLGLMYKDFELALLINASVATFLSVAPPYTSFASCSVGFLPADNVFIPPVASVKIESFPLSHISNLPISDTYNADMWNGANVFDGANIDADIMDIDIDTMSVLSLLWPTLESIASTPSPPAQQQSSVASDGVGPCAGAGAVCCDPVSVLAIYTPTEIGRLHEDSGLAPHLLTIPFDMQNFANQRNFSGLRELLERTCIPHCAFLGKYEVADLVQTESVVSMLSVMFDMAPDFVLRLQTIQLSQGYTMTAIYQLTGTRLYIPHRKLTTQSDHERALRIMHNSPMTGLVREFERIAYILDYNCRHYTFTSHLLFTFTTNLRKEKILRITLDSQLVDIKARM